MAQGDGIFIGVRESPSDVVSPESALRIGFIHQADVNAIGDMGETPLHAAVRDASPDTLAALLAGGAREDIVSEFGKTPLQLAQLLKRDCVYRKAQSIARDMKRAKRQSHREV